MLILKASLLAVFYISLLFLPLRQSFAQQPTPFLFGSDTSGFFIKDLGGDVKFRIDQSGFLQAPLKYPPSGDNLIQNGSFESKVDSNASVIADGWTQNYQTSCANCSYSLNTVSGNFKSGKQAAALSINASGGTSSIASADTPIEAGKDYKASIDIKCSVNTSTAISILYFSGTIGSTTYADRSGTSETVFSGTCGTTWSTKELTFTARSNCSDSGGGTSGTLDCTRTRMLIATTTISSTLYADNAKVTSPSANTQLTANNISSGSFGANTGGGNYTFPALVTVGNGLTVSAGTITLPDNSIASADVAFNYAGAASKGGAATTATALAANGSNCSAGSFPLGIDASGAIESCTTVSSLAPGLTGSGASGTWGINVTGSSGSVAWGNVSGKPTSITRIADLTGSYGSINIAGTAGGYAGINFSDEGLILMMDGAGATGVYTGTAWKWYFDTNGALTAGTVPWGRVTGFTGDTTADTIADNGVISTGETDFTNQALYTSSAPTFADVYNNGWFRNYGSTGLYNQTYGRGIWAAEAGGNSYGNFTTYDAGRNGWAGWGIGSRYVFMSNGGGVGIHDNSYSWVLYDDGTDLNLYNRGTMRLATKTWGVYIPDSVGIGTTGPGKKLQVNDGDGYMTYGDTSGVQVYNAEGSSGEVRLGSAWGLKGVYSSTDLGLYSEGGYRVNIGNGANNYLTVYGGSVGIGTSVPARKLDVVGDIQTSSDFFAPGMTVATGTIVHVGASGKLLKSSSSRRYKDNIADWEIGPAVLDQVRPVTFTWNNLSGDPGKRDYGLIAEEVYSYFPEAINFNEKRQVESIDLGKFTVALIARAQQDKQEISSLKKRMEEFARQLQSQQKQIDLLMLR